MKNKITGLLYGRFDANPVAGLGIKKTGRLATLLVNRQHIIF
jgi:hypothetical protein